MYRLTVTLSRSGEETMDLYGRSILVVEDEPLIRVDITGRLEAAGAKVLAASLRLAEEPDLSGAVLDFDLGSADSTAVCWKLTDRRVPFLFHTGRFYSAFRQWPGAPVILKPSTHGLIAAVARLFP